MTADLGAKSLRVFLAWPGVTRHPQLGRYDVARPLWDVIHERFTREEIWDWCREGMMEAARYAAEFGVHACAAESQAGGPRPSRRLARWCGRSIRPASRSAWIRVSCPIGGPRSCGTRLSTWGRCRSCRTLAASSTAGAEGVVRARAPANAEVRDDDYNLAFVRAMREIGYHGYVGYELCPSVAGRRRTSRGRGIRREECPIGLRIHAWPDSQGGLLRAGRSGVLPLPACHERNDASAAPRQAAASTGYDCSIGESAAWRNRPPLSYQPSLGEATPVQVDEESVPPTGAAFHRGDHATMGQGRLVVEAEPVLGDVLSHHHDGFALGRDCHRRPRVSNG